MQKLIKSPCAWIRTIPSPLAFAEGLFVYKKDFKKDLSYIELKYIQKLSLRLIIKSKIEGTLQDMLILGYKRSSSITLSYVL